MLIPPFLIRRNPLKNIREPTGERYKNTGKIQNSFKICKLAPNDQWPIFGLPHVLNGGGEIYQNSPRAEGFFPCL